MSFFSAAAFPVAMGSGGFFAMLVDAFTEMIAHFIGLFQLESEAGRSRLDYDAFKSFQHDEQLPPLPAGGVPKNIIFDPNGHDPAVNSPQGFHQAKITAPHVQLNVELPAASSVHLPSLTLETPLVIGSAGAEATSLPPVVETPAPGGNIQITVQANWLNDSDVLNVSSDVAIAWGAFQLKALEALEDQAEALQILSLDEVMGATSHVIAPEDLPEKLAEMSDAALAVSAAQPGASITLKLGAETADTTVNGETAESLPDWAELLPDLPEREEGGSVSSSPSTPHSDGQAVTGNAQAGQAIHGLADRVAELDDEAGATLVEETSPSAMSQSAEETQVTDPADTAGSAAASVSTVPHTLLTGGNLIVNATASSTTGVDAPIIAVAGNVSSLDVISQVNVLRDDAEEPGLINTLHNSAQITGAPPSHSQTTDLPVAPLKAAAIPGVVGLTSIEGDLINYTWSQQTNYSIDQDTVRFEASGTESWISLGENQLLNTTAVAGLGMGFDVILVGGDMLSQYIIQQTNVLNDWDAVSWQASAEGAGDFVASGAAEYGGDGSIGSSGNVAINSASIIHTAVDDFSGLSQDFKSALDSFAAGAPDLSSIFGSTPLGSPGVLSALYISGDLIDLHVVSQTNTLSDADLVQLASKDTESEGGARAETGLNATVNTAQLVDMGLDTVIMSGGDVFSDAVLYQANLISDDAPPNDVFLAPTPLDNLATEAVAFLAEDVTDAPSGIDLFSPQHGFGQEGPVPADVMQTMLA